MTVEIVFMFALLLTVIIIFIIDKLPMDLVALMVVGVLAISGIITPKEAVSGFGNSLVIMIAGLFIVGEALLNTGVANVAGNWLLKVGGSSETRLLLFLLPMVAFLSAFMSSTGAVALLIPIVLSLARKSTMQRGLIFMPLSFAAMIGGMLTLIGTPPNIVVSAQMSDAGLKGFGFFDFTPIGLAILVVGIIYLIFVGRFLLPTSATQSEITQQKTLNHFAKEYQLHQQLHKLSIHPDSPMINKTLMDLKLRREYDVTVFALKHQKQARASTLIAVMLNTIMQSNDTLWVYGIERDVKRLCEELTLIEHDTNENEIRHLERHFGFAEILIPPDSSYAGRRISKLRFRENLGLNPIGLIRNHESLPIVFTKTRLQAGDSLLLSGGWGEIRRLGNNRDLVILDTPTELEDIPLREGKALTALGVMMAMLIVMTVGWLPNLSAIILAALAMIITGCLSLKEAYHSINTTSLVLIAGLLPMAEAMERSGAAAYLVHHLISLFQGAPPLAICAAFFVLTSILSQFISNTATTVLLAPIALETAQLLSLNPQPFMMTVAIAASTAFATPIASPINTLVLGPGNYRFVDFAKVGIPLQLLALVISLTLTPICFPF